MRPVVVLLALAWLASVSVAGRHIMQRGETLDHVAEVFGCSTEAVLKANHLTNTLVPAGTVVEVPACNVRDRVHVRDAVETDDRARRALAVIDGTTVVKPAAPDRSARVGVSAPPRVTVMPDDPDQSVGAPWRGRLRNGESLPRGDGYRIRRPNRAYGASHVITHLQRVIGEVRALYPDVHTLAIGDLSAPEGGKLADHASHQSGVDVDIGFYFTTVPNGYPDQFVPANANLDLEAMWALVTAFARTTDLDTGVQIIFLDYDVQARLHAYARKRGTPDTQLAELFQYPRGKDTLAGLVRHWPHHGDHLHVRFKPGSD